MPELQFDELNHEYRIDGRPLPSVTQVLEDVGIIDYSKIPNETREQALERGRVVHLCTQFDDEFSRDGQQLADEQIADSVRGYVEAWRRFRRETGFTPDLIEYRSYHATHLYAGTLDRTGVFRAERTRFVVDLKTGTAAPWTRIQTAAYSAFFTTPRLFPRLAVELHKDGTYSVPFGEWHGREWQEHFNLFLSALNCYREKHPSGVAEKRRAA
jgi:hypothetical protein